MAFYEALDKLCKTNRIKAVEEPPRLSLERRGETEGGEET